MGSDKVVSSQPEEIGSTARIGESITVPSKLADEKPKKEVDLKHITSLDELKSIQKQDPFMYFSIPGVRSAQVFMKDIDTSNLLGASAEAGHQDVAPRSQKVSRMTCISFECHPDLLLDDSLDDLDFEGTEDHNTQE